MLKSTNEFQIFPLKSAPAIGNNPPIGCLYKWDSIVDGTLIINYRQHDGTDKTLQTGAQKIINVTDDFDITADMSGALITNYGATQNITGTFASGLSAGFWVDVANEVESGGIDGYTKLMLHMNGSDDGTTFTDSSASAHTVTATNAVTKTGTKKFGTASSYFDGNGDYLSVPDSDVLDLDTSDFTIDFWIYSSAVGQSNNSCVIAKANNVSNMTSYAVYQMNGTYDLKFYGATTSQWDLINGATIGTLTQNTWAHIAIVRSGATVKCYFNGVEASSTSVGTSSFYANAYTLIIGGGNYANTYTTGYIDEFRISKGIARWTTTFTPPNAEYYTTKITLTPASGEELPGTAYADNTLTSNSKGDVKNFFNTGNSWISKYTTGTWEDGL